MILENSRPEEENKDIRNLNKQKKKELNYTAIKDMRNVFRLEKETKAINDKIFRDVKNLFEPEEQKKYFKSVRISNFWINNYIECESNNDRNKALSVKEYLYEIRLYLKDIKNLKKSDT